jgi:hypothetical protein
VYKKVIKVSDHHSWVVLNKRTLKIGFLKAEMSCNSIAILYAKQ